jgi:hypothetical protein
LLSRSIEPVTSIPAAMSSLCQVDVVDFEQGDRAARLLTEEREVRIPRREHLNSIPARQGQLRRCRLLELDT